TTIVLTNKTVNQNQYTSNSFVTVCHNSQSAVLLSSSGLVMYFKYTSCAFRLSALHLDYFDAPSCGLLCL
ncbi:MAG: hypothetical protein ACI4TS_06215, partial [Bacteroidaceae bacterium]